MTTVYYLDGDQLVMMHYCSLGNQPFLVALPNEEVDITFEFVKLGNMKDINEHYIHSHSLEFLSEHEMTAHWGGWKDQASYQKDRTFRVERLRTQRIHI